MCIKHGQSYFVVVAVQKTHTRPNGLLSTLLKRSVCVFACLHLADSSSLSLSLVSPQVFSAPQTGLQSLQSYPPVSCSLSQQPVHHLSPSRACLPHLSSLSSLPQSQTQLSRETALASKCDGSSRKSSCLNANHFCNVKIELVGKLIIQGAQKLTLSYILTS